MDDQIAVRFLDRHDLEFPTAIVVSDPAEHGRARIRIGGDDGIGRGDHVVGGTSADSVFTGSPSEPDRLHPNIVSGMQTLCKTQPDLASVPITRITGDARGHPSTKSAYRSGISRVVLSQVHISLRAPVAGAGLNTTWPSACDPAFAFHDPLLLDPAIR